MSKLELMFEKQIQLMDKLGVPYIKSPTAEFRTEEVLTEASVGISFALTDEIHEFMRELNWKPWKKTKKIVDIVKVQNELIDCWHFLIELSIIWGLEAEDVANLYLQKNQVNVTRQQENY